MIHVITSNIIPISSIKDYNDNFIISHLVMEPIIPLAEDGYHYRVYHQSEMSIDQYSAHDNFRFDYTETPDITNALDLITSTITASIISGSASDTQTTSQEGARPPEDDDEEVMVLVACDYNWNSQVVDYLNEKFAEESSDVTCLDIYEYLNDIDTEKLVQTLKQTLGTEFIYPEEPVSFGYAIHEALHSRWG